MADLSGQIEQARKAGYSDAEIVGFLKQKEPKVTKALESGYQPQEVLSYLTRAAAPAAPVTPPGQIPGAVPGMVAPPAVSEVPMGRRAIQMVRPTVEALGAVGGGALGTVGAPGLGTVAGASLGYGLAKGGLDVVEQALGYQRAPSSVKEALTRGAEDVLTGAAYETAGRVAAPFVAKGLEKFGQVAAKALDIKGRQATKLAQASAGDQIDAIRAALRNAAPGDTPAQATVGIPRKVWQSLNELGSSLDATDVVLKQQSDDLFADLSRIARGGNATEIRNALTESRRVLNQLTSPMRETELAAANQAAQTMAALGPRVAQKQASMISALREGKPAPVEAPLKGTLLRGFVTGEARQGQSMLHPSTEAALGVEAAAKQLQRVAPGQIPAVSATQAARAQAASARQFQETADVFSNIATQRRTERDFIQRQIGSLEDYGLRPLDVSNVTSALESAMAAPGRRVSAQQQQVLGKVRDQLQAAAALNNGVIDARDLYTIRKEGVNEIIEDLMKGRDPKVSKKVAADVLEIVRPEIDKAISQAGGTGWKAYLDTFAEGAKELEKRQMAAEAVRMFKDQPQEYVKLVRGNHPEAVEAVFGTGNFDIFKEMSKDMPTLEKAASYIERQAQIGKMAAGGREELLKIIDQTSWRRRLPNWFNPAITTANLALRDVEKRLNEATLKTIQQASTSNKSMLELLEGLPAPERTKLTRIINSPAFFATTAPGRAMITVVAPGKDRTNKLAPESQNVNALAP